MDQLEFVFSGILLGVSQKDAWKMAFIVKCDYTLNFPFSSSSKHKALKKED